MFFVLAISRLLTWILKGISTAPADGAQILLSVEALSALCDASKTAKVKYYQMLGFNKTVGLSNTVPQCSG